MGKTESATGIKKPAGNHGYSWQIGFIYVFNLLIGSGLLALPKAFAEVGWVLGVVALTLLAFISYITVTFTVEAMSIANALVRCNTETPDGKEQVKLQCCIGDAQVVPNPNADGKGDVKEPPKSVTEFAWDNSKNIAGNDVVANHTCDSTESNAAVAKRTKDIVTKGYGACEYNIYDFSVTYQLGEMANLLFHKIGVLLYYVTICLYLYGSQSIYAVAISKSLTIVVCGDKSDFLSNITAPCGSVHSLSVLHIYRISLAAFVLLICPFAYFEISNTKLLQVFTTTYRWFSMIAMIVLAFVKIGKGKGDSSTKLFAMENLPHFFGVSVYAFMCQPSIPAVVTPVTSKHRVKLVLILDFICVLLFYVTILMSAVYAFAPEDILDIYTLNFIHPISLKYVLQLFPVLTLAASFPIYSIVLRDNIKKLALNSEQEYNLFVRRILFPTIVIIPPIVVAYNTCNVGNLVSYTGTYAGAIIQYVIPAMLVYCGRRKMTKVLGIYENVYQSPFRHQFWIALVMFWYIVCLVFVTYNKVKGI